MGSERVPEPARSAPARRTALPAAGVRRMSPGNAALTGFMASTSPPTAQRDPSAAQLGDASRQLALSRLLSWGLRGIQYLVSILGLKGALRGGVGFPVGVDLKGEAVVARLFPGVIDDVAMVVAGVHGSEQSGVDVADRLIAQLQTHQPYYTVVVVPRLFPSNVAGRAEWERKLAAEQKDIALKEYKRLRDEAGDPGRVSPGQEDPNRQFPDLGKSVDPAKPVDSKGRLIEPSNLALISLVETFGVKRLVSLHAIKEASKAGIFADPHPSVVAGTPQESLGTEADDLAIRMAERAKALGAGVAGNERATGFSSLYPGQDPARAKEQIARENKKGRSLGQWGPSRGMSVITVEVSEQYAAGSAVKDPNRGTELEAHATAIREIFLGPPAKGASGTGAGTGRTAEPEKVPVQRVVVQRVARLQGNRAASRTVHRIHASAANHDGGVVVSRFVGDLVESLAEAASAVVGAVTTGVSAVAEGLRDISYGMPAERAFVKRMVMSGVTDADALTRMVFSLRHPGSALRRLNPKDPADKPLIAEWKRLKKELVDPSIQRYRARRELTAAERERQVKQATTQAQSKGQAGAREFMDRDIRAVTKKGVDDWFAGHVPDATFLGRRIHGQKGSAVGGVHKNLLAKLDKAESILSAMPQFRGMRGIDLADAVGLETIGGLRPPVAATGGERPSLHSYGLAVDINAHGNPFIGLHGDAVPKMVARASLLVRGQAFRIEEPPKTHDRSVMEQWAATHAASEDVITYLAMDTATLEHHVEELARARPDLPSAQRTLSWWKARQAEDRSLKNKGDFTGWRDPAKQGLMDLSEHLVRALAQAGLTWGGMYKTDKDLMHFDDRSLFRTASKEE